MAADDKKRYYWLKLHKDFFKRHDITIIEAMENGKDYVLFYLKLLLESVSHEGRLRFSEVIPYNEKMLSSLTGTNIDIVRSAMQVFNELKMIEILDDGTLYMQEVEALIGSETGYTRRQRENRVRTEKVSIGCQLGVNDTKRLEIRDKSKNTNYPVISNVWDNHQQCECLTKNGERCERRASYQIDGKLYCNQHSKTVLKPAIDRANRFTPPTLEETTNYFLEINSTSDEANRFYDYYTSNGWKVGNKGSMKDWKASARNWVRNNKNWERKRASELPNFTNNSKPIVKESTENVDEWYEQLQKDMEKLKNEGV